MSEEGRSNRQHRGSAQKDSEARMLEVYRVPVVATLLFVLLMLSIWGLGRQVVAEYAAYGVLF
jgi:hypothetical protein